MILCHLESVWVIFSRIKDVILGMVNPYNPWARGIPGMGAVQVWALLITCSSDKGAELSWEGRNTSERRMMWNYDPDLLKTVGNLKSSICLSKLRCHSLQFLQFSSMKTAKTFLVCEPALNLWTARPAYSEPCKPNNNNEKNLNKAWMP